MAETKTDYIKLSKEKNKGKVNPFDFKISYVDFLNAIPKGTKVSTYLKDICTTEQIEFIESELKLLKK